MNKLAVFNNKKIRRTLHNDEWWFSIVDVAGALSETQNARRYWSDLKRQLIEKEGFFELYEKIVQLKLLSADGKFYETDCANTEGLLRIIQSIPLESWPKNSDIFIFFGYISEYENSIRTT